VRAFHLRCACQGGEGPDAYSLVRLVFPDLQEKDGAYAASRTVPIRSSFDDDRPTAWQDQFQVRLVEQRVFAVENRRFIAVLLSTSDVDDTGNPPLLAVFDRSQTAVRLVDVVAVRLDRECRFGTGELLNIECTHHNSQLVYTFHRFLTVAARADRVVSIAEISLRNQQGVCGATFEQKLAVSATAGQRIVAFRVKAITHPDEPGLGCNKPKLRPSVRYFRATFAREPLTGRYKTFSKQLDSLATWNQKNN
jgi:hypothetical protein